MTTGGLESLLTANDVMRVLKVSRTTLWRLQHEAGFSKPITFGRRLKRWKVSQIEAYLDAKKD